jgi:hypothetical protein
MTVSNPNVVTVKHHTLKLTPNERNEAAKTLVRLMTLTITTVQLWDSVGQRRLVVALPSFLSHAPKWTWKYTMKSIYPIYMISKMRREMPRRAVRRRWGSQRPGLCTVTVLASSSSMRPYGAHLPKFSRSFLLRLTGQMVDAANLVGVDLKVRDLKSSK